MDAKYILYDLPTRDPRKCWSVNPWKTRLILNYKNLPYETQWVEYPDIKPMFEGKVPNPWTQSDTTHTIPTVQFRDGTYLQDSLKIAERLEKEHPDPNLRLNAEMHQRLRDLLPDLFKAIYPDFVPKVAKRLLTEASQPYFYRTREADFGKPLDQIEAELGGDTAWMNAAPTMQKISKLLRENTGGPYFEGNQVTYVDFVWVAFMKFMQTIGDDIYQHMLEASGDREVHEALFKACDPWLIRDAN